MEHVTVMIVDDHEDFRDILSKYLEAEGYSVMQAEDGETALEAVKFKKPHLIILDVMMPRLDGYDVCRAIKANPETAHIPIVFLTAKSSLGDKLSGYISGGQRYLCKPFEMSELDECLRAVLHQQDIRGMQMNTDSVYGAGGNGISG